MPQNHMTQQPVYFSGNAEPERVLLSLAERIDDDFALQMETALGNAAMRKGYDLTVLDSKNSVALQKAQVESARRRGDSAIIIHLVDPAAAKDILDAAKGMKVLLINRPPADLRLLNENVIFIGSDERVAGELQGRWLANAFKAQGKKEMAYILLKGPPHVPSTYLRSEGALGTLLEEGILLVQAAPNVVANFDHTQALVQMIALLRTGVKPDVIISNNDAMALGAIEALEYIGAKDNKPLVVGIDATAPAIRALADGKLDMTVFHDADAKANAALLALANMQANRPATQGLEQYQTQDSPYNLHVPFQPVTRHLIPKNLYF